MRVFYRISDKGNYKPKLPGATKEFCFKNFLECFECPIYLITDNCDDETIEMCQKALGKRNSMVYQTSNGNAGSFRWCLDIIENMSISPTEVIYFVEDDYLHRYIFFENSPGVSPQQELEMVLKRNDVDYASLYDHPDKYQDNYERGEDTKVFRTEFSHWKFSVSTTMTFATTKQVLLQDLDIWKEHTTNDENHPYDHRAFLDLKDKGRQLAVRIPGIAFHTDLSPIMEPMFVDKWAVELLEEHLVNQMLPEKDWLVSDLLDLWSNLPSETSVRRLMMMSAMQDIWKPPSHLQFKTSE